MKTLVKISDIQQRESWKDDLIRGQINYVKQNPSLNDLQMKKTALRAIQGLSEDNRRDIMLIGMILQK